MSARQQPVRRGTAEPDTLRVLVGCSTCRRQYDASQRQPGERLRCLCGGLLEVPREIRGVARIVRCSACGAARGPDSPSCSYCSAPFAGAERDRNTVCPGCARRISDRARFCPGCGIRVDPRGRAGEATEKSCPACEPPTYLVSRPFPDPPGNVLECPRCGGLWVGRDLFAELTRRARDVAADLPPAKRTRLGERRPVVYRPCPDCSRRMNRRNYGGTSGVIVDLCAEDGLWFDDDELERLLGWIRSGGLERAAQRAAEERRRRDLERRRRRAEISEPPIAGDDPRIGGDLAALGDLLAGLFQLGRTLLGRGGGD